MNLVAPKAAAKLQLLSNKLASERLLDQSKIATWSRVKE